MDSKRKPKYDFDKDLSDLNEDYAQKEKRLERMLVEVKKKSVEFRNKKLNTAKKGIR